MASPAGFLLPAASLGLGALLFRPPRGFFKSGTKDEIFVPHAVIDERHVDRLQITEHPIEVGSVVADHAFMLPAKLVVHCLWSNSPPAGKLDTLTGALLAASQFGSKKLATAVGLAAAAGPTFSAVQSLLSGNGPAGAKEVYQKLLALQKSRTPFDVYTGKRAYKDMLIEELGVETSRTSENMLDIVVGLHEVLFASPVNLTIPLNIQSLANPEKNLPPTPGGARNLTPAPNFNGTTVP